MAFKGLTRYSNYTPIGKTAFSSLSGRTVSSDTIKVEVYYSKGGMSYWDYKTYPRGFYLSLTPMTLDAGKHFTSETYTMGSTVGFFLEAAPRLNGKRLAAHAAKWLEEKTRTALVTAFLDGSLAAFIASEDASAKEATSAATPMKLAGGA